MVFSSYCVLAIIIIWLTREYRQTAGRVRCQTRRWTDRVPFRQFATIVAWAHVPILDVKVDPKNNPNSKGGENKATKEEAKDGSPKLGAHGFSPSASVKVDTVCESLFLPFSAIECPCKTSPVRRSHFTWRQLYDWHFHHGRGRSWPMPFWQFATIVVWAKVPALENKKMAQKRSKTSKEGRHGE